MYKHRVCGKVCAPHAYFRTCMHTVLVGVKWWSGNEKQCKTAHFKNMPFSTICIIFSQSHTFQFIKFIFQHSIYVDLMNFISFHLPLMSMFLFLILDLNYSVNCWYHCYEFIFAYWRWRHHSITISLYRCELELQCCNSCSCAERLRVKTAFLTYWSMSTIRWEGVFRDASDSLYGCVTNIAVDNTAAAGPHTLFVRMYALFRLSLTIRQPCV